MGGESAIRLSNKQKRALEKVTGKSWKLWHPEAVTAYFAFTDKGQKLQISKEIESDLFELITCHKFHAYTIECWKNDFRKGLLFLNDFLGSPPSYIAHACDIYEQVMGYESSYLREFRKGKCHELGTVKEYFR